jgi:hypothetical protein
VRVLGFYSIRPGALAFARVPADITSKLGRYEVPVFRLGRLAGGVALAIDAEDEPAARWYQRFGALPLLDDPLKLILLLGVVAEALRMARRRRK